MFMAGYAVFSKVLLKRYHPVYVTGWSYLTASSFMLCAMEAVSRSHKLLSFVCSDPDPLQMEACVAGPWYIPMSMALPLVYWILIGSLLGYFLVTWANKYAKASVVGAYTVLQPIVAGV